MTRQEMSNGIEESLSSPCQGRRMSPTPMSSAPERRRVPSRRAIAPSSTRRPNPSLAARTCGAGSHRPVGTSTAAARSSRWAAASRGPSRVPARSGSSSRTATISSVTECGYPVAKTCMRVSHLD
jgi:hypothetical protein